MTVAGNLCHIGANIVECVCRTVSHLKGDAAYLTGLQHTVAVVVDKMNTPDLQSLSLIVLRGGDRSHSGTRTIANVQVDAVVTAIVGVVATALHSIVLIVVTIVLVVALVVLIVALRHTVLYLLALLLYSSLLRLISSITDSRAYHSTAGHADDASPVTAARAVAQSADGGTKDGAERRTRVGSAGCVRAATADEQRTCHCVYKNLFHLSFQINDSRCKDMKKSLHRQGENPENSVGETRKIYLRACLDGS